MKRLGLAASFVCILAASDAHAIDRNGFLFGFGVGGGSITCDGCDTLSGPAAEIHLGGMIGDRLALLAEGSAVSKTEDGDTLISAFGGGALQFWASERFWLKGGAGLGQLRFESGRFAVESDSGLAFLGAAGVELAQKRRFAIDLQFRFSTAKIEDERFNNFSGVIGFNWY